MGFSIKVHGLLLRVHDDFPRERRPFLGDQEILRTGNKNHTESVFDRFSADEAGFVVDDLFAVVDPAVISPCIS